MVNVSALHTVTAVLFGAVKVNITVAISQVDELDETQYDVARGLTTNASREIIELLTQYLHREYSEAP
jgi:hypothetical protein